MEVISKAILSFFDLVEAEGRAFKKITVSVVEGLLFISFGMAFMFVGALVMAASVYLWLATFMDKITAIAIIGAAIFGIGVLLFAKGRSSARRKSIDKPAQGDKPAAEITPVNGGVQGE